MRKEISDTWCATFPTMGCAVALSPSPGYWLHASRRPGTGNLQLRTNANWAIGEAI